MRRFRSGKYIPGAVGHVPLGTPIMHHHFDLGQFHARVFFLSPWFLFAMGTTTGLCVSGQEGHVVAAFFVWTQPAHERHTRGNVLRLFQVFSWLPSSHFVTMLCGVVSNGAQVPAGTHCLHQP